MLDRINEIYESNYQLMLHVGYLYSGNIQEAEELIHEAFIRLMIKGPKDKNDTEIKKWLMRVLINMCFDEKRKFWVRLKYAFNIIERSEEYGLNCVEVKDQLRINLKEVDSKTRMVIILKYAEEMDYREISDLMNMPEGTIKSMVSRGIKQIRGRNNEK